jgi:hypothetical protein
MMTDAQLTVAASAVLDTIRIVGRSRRMTDGEIITMASIAFVEMIGNASGPHGLVTFLRDLADKIEADNRQKVA